MRTLLVPTHRHIAQCLLTHCPAHYRRPRARGSAIDKELTQCASHTKELTLARITNRTLALNFKRITHGTAHCKNMRSMEVLEPKHGN